MTTVALGNTNLAVTPIGFGAFKIGRDAGTKYPGAYQIPDEGEAVAIVHAMLDLGINYIDTAPAYGLSEERVGKALDALTREQRDNVVVSTKVGEAFSVVDGQPHSEYRYDAASIRASIDRSRERLGRDTLDIVFIHSNGEDDRILNATDAVETLTALRDAGTVRAIGLSGKTAVGFAQSFDWADVAMVEYSPAAPELADTITLARERGIGVIVKKALASGHLPADEALRFVFDHPGVNAAVIGTLNPDHMRANLTAASRE
ncbi:MAG: aldo/keto reductase [Planctomycetota bacterium]